MPSPSVTTVAHASSPGLDARRLDPVGDRWLGVSAVGDRSSGVSSVVRSSVGAPG
jgi:hypothetical protein